jgi:arylsulfatase A-like enzyme
VLPDFVDVLEELELFKSGLVAITSDHGEGLFDHDNFFGHIDNLYEETINVPLILSLPEAAYNPVKIEQPRVWNVEAIDLTKTILEFGNARRDALPGNSILSYLKRVETPEQFQSAFAEKGFVDRIHKTAVVSENKKLIYDYRKSTERLYDLKDRDVEGEPYVDNERIQRLKSLIFKTLGATSALNRKPAPPKDIPAAERKQLKGLGYLE